MNQRRQPSLSRERWQSIGHEDNLLGCRRSRTPATSSRPPLSSTRYGFISDFTLRYRDVEDLLAEHHLDITYETVRRGC